MPSFWSSLFVRKPVEAMLKEMEGDARLHRVLGPVALTSLGVGATIGTGIFVLTGVAAKDYAGPSLMLSFVLAGIGCGGFLTGCFMARRAGFPGDLPAMVVPGGALLMCVPAGTR